MFFPRIKWFSLLYRSIPQTACNIVNETSKRGRNTSSLFVKANPIPIKSLSYRAPYPSISVVYSLPSIRGCSSNAGNNDISKNSKILMEFFDEPLNWPENEIKSGRAWKLDELRIKSNKELHQLWFILLKERNMLLTMEHECDKQMELFPSPERLDKVKLSMNNLETVVRERNRAYHLLETGETGERPVRLMRSKLGMHYRYKFCEHVLPPFMNVKWIKSRYMGPHTTAVRKFLRLYREKYFNEKRRLKNRNRNEVMMLLRRNCDLDHSLLKVKYPDVNIDTLIHKGKTRGHYVPKIEV